MTRLTKSEQPGFTKQLNVTLEGTKMKLFKNFKNDESGAVTVDWVVLTAALVLVGGTVLTAVSGGMENLAGDIATQLSTQSLGTSSSSDS